MNAKLRSDLTALAFQVGGVLNLVMDDDQRDELHGHFERALNDELHAGSENRRLVQPLHDALRRVGFREVPVSNVVGLHSVRVTAAEFDRLVDEGGAA